MCSEFENKFPFIVTDFEKIVLIFLKKLVIFKNQAQQMPDCNNIEIIANSFYNFTYEV